MPRKKKAKVDAKKPKKDGGCVEEPPKGPVEEEDGREENDDYSKGPSIPKGLQKSYREYLVALEQALDDKVITREEMQVLEYLRAQYGITRDENDILMAVMLKRMGGHIEEWLPDDDYFQDLFTGRKYTKPKSFSARRQKI